jgi:RNA polymerase sigma-70 factor (ECF subfamily)
MTEAVASTIAAATTDADDAVWVEELRGRSPDRHAALARLHLVLLRAARAELARRAPPTGIGGPELDDLAHQAADDALVAILRRLPEFRGESRFTTWAYRFALLEVSSKLGRHFWNTRGAVAVEVDERAQPPAQVGLSPESALEAADLGRAVRRAVETGLTARQRAIFVALAVDGLPLDTVAKQLAMDRNTIYKVMFDARRRLRATLRTLGYLDAPSTGAR